ncbi:hypothetical protein [Suicoccus acidiformans]|uniref:hypothetical protein n=1 Tax=Suicoccus acidiformans TaxID=2036206 RepID=UPI0013C36D1F|nr:hypothetical protein [Suicoccus acidiformans]
MINSTTTGRRFKHFTPEMRGRLEQMYQEGRILKSKWQRYSVLANLLYHEW